MLQSVETVSRDRSHNDEFVNAIVVQDFRGRCPVRACQIEILLQPKGLLEKNKVILSQHKVVLPERRGIGTTQGDTVSTQEDK